MIKSGWLFLAAIASLAAAPDARAQTAWDKVAAALGKSGSEMPGKVYRAGFPRTDLKVSLDSVEIRPAFALGGWLAFQSVGARWSWAISSRPKAMGSAIVIDFQPIGGGQAAIAGDFVLLADEVNPVLATLCQNGIEVTAVHNHMLDDRPRTFYAHFWAVDDAAKLAGGPRAALDKLKLARN